MPDDGNIEAIYYTSLFRHEVDEKRRVQVPSKWRPSEGEVEFTLFLWPNGSVPDSHLMVLPPKEMKSLVEKIRLMPASDPRASALRRLLGSKSAIVTPDKSGRICLPEEMAKTVGIEKKALLVGLMDRFEIWNPERYETVSAVDAALTSEAFKLI
jgi:MraZ protein